MDTIHSDIFPDGTPVDGWFHNTSIPELTKLGKQYIITDYGIHDDGRIYTDNFQKLIDLVYNAGGGVIVIPHGTYMTGALFFRQGVNLYIEGGATLIQLREKALDDEAFLEEAVKMKVITDAYHVPLIINDNIDVCIKSGAAGVHARQKADHGCDQCVRSRH